MNRPVHMDCHCWNWRVKCWEDQNSFFQFLFRGKEKHPNGKIKNQESDFTPREDGERREYAFIPRHSACPWFLTPNWAERKESTIWIAVQDQRKDPFNLVSCSPQSLETDGHREHWNRADKECPFLGNFQQAMGRHLLSRNWKGNYCA